MEEVSLQKHYDLLIDEGDDPVHDPPALKEYMSKWDGPEFIKALDVDKNKSVLEIVAGTGRTAVQIISQCACYTGIDISPKAVERLNQNLLMHSNKNLICADFLNYKFNEKFDIIYSTLTFFHIEDKTGAIMKVSSLLNSSGRFVLSISKDISDKLIYNERSLTLFPDSVHNIREDIINSGLAISEIIETELAYIFVADNNQQIGR